MLYPVLDDDVGPGRLAVGPGIADRGSALVSLIVVLVSLVTARLPNGRASNTIDIFLRNGSLLVLVDDDQPLVGGFVHFDNQGLGSALLIDAQLRTAFDRFDLVPRIVRGHRER